jgi:hypothetical protein
MKTCSLIRLAFTVLALGLCATARAQWEDPVVIDDNYQYRDYPLQEGAPLEFGRRPAGVGSVLFETNPTGAKVYIEDIYQGETPLLISNVQDGTYSARFEKEGYLNYYTVFDVAATLQSHVTAGLQLRPHYFFDRKELYTTLIYENSDVNAEGWGVGNSWGVYLNNINLEQTTLVHIGITNTVLFEGSVGYGFMMGRLNRFRLTPQVGYSVVWYDHVDTAKSGWREYLRGGLNFKCAFTEQYAFSASLLYDKTGIGFRAGVLFYVN